MPLPRMAPPPTVIPGPRPRPQFAPGGPIPAPPRPPCADPTPASPQSRRPGRPALLVAIAAAAVAVLVLGGMLLTRPGGLLSVQPCDAAPGSSLPGFDDVVGPTPMGGPGSLLQNPFPDGRLCSYATAGANPVTMRQSGGHLIFLMRAPRAAVDADPELGETFRNAAAGRTQPYSSAYPVSLVRSGVTLVATPGSDGSGSTVSATCVAGADYWSVWASSYAPRDDAGALDALLVALGCGPVPGTS